MLSIMLTDHNLSAEQLSFYGRSIKAGRPPLMPESEKAKLRPALEEAKVLLGRKRPGPQGATAKASKQPFNFAAFWPYLVPLAALAPAWLYFEQPEWKLGWFAAALVLICVPVIFVLFWRAKNRAFRAEVTIETLRLWRGMVEDYRSKNPKDRMTKGMSVPEEAVYMATHGPAQLRQKVMAMAWDNVKKMTKYHVQECRMGKGVGGWQEIFANSDEEAANKVVSGQLRRSGKLGELRVRVRLADNPKQEADFYTDN